MPTEKNPVYFLRVSIGLVVALFGLLATGFGILGILDPVGTKMSDDSDPFGTPPSFLESMIRTLVFASITGFGVWLIAYKKSKAAKPS
jgi:hypothetical protein